MKKRTFAKFVSTLLITTTVLSCAGITASARDITETWKTLGCKYSVSSMTAILAKGRTEAKLVGYEFTETADSGIAVSLPDYDVFPGRCAVSALSSMVKTPLAGLEVTIQPEAKYDFTMDEFDISGGFSMIWSENPIDSICNPTDRTGMYWAESLADGLRNLAPLTGKSLCVYVTNNYLNYNETKSASTVAVIYLDGTFTDASDSQPGMRWWFRARNYKPHTNWADSSGITQKYENVDISSGLTFAVRADTDLGYAVSVNGKEYCRGNQVAYFPNNTKIVEVDGGQNDYADMADSWVNSITYARKDIDLSALRSVAQGYLTIGANANCTKDKPYDYTVKTINGIPAFNWNGETNTHTHTPGEYKQTTPSCCTLTGTRTLLCTQCGAVIGQEQTQTDLAVHLPETAWTVLRSPTATEPGIEVKYCRFHGATIAEQRENPFTDVGANSWYADASIWCYNKHIIEGTGAGAFSPKVTLSRAMMVTILAGMSGEATDAYDGSADFDDVRADSWYAHSVGWACANGITDGTAARAFDPTGDVSRQQLALFYMAYAQYKGYSTETRADLNAYADAASVSSWAREAVSWAVGEGLISGTDSITLSPKLTATRAQCAVITKAFDERFNTAY